MAVRYGYFVLQSRFQLNHGLPELDGVVENLTTGERRDFRSIQDVAGLIGTWAMEPKADPPRPVDPGEQP